MAKAAPNPDVKPVRGVPPPLGYTLRVSLLEQCQYDCPYCLPGSVSRYTPNQERLSAAEYGRLAPLLASAGVNRVRLTGGEPLLRNDVPDVVAAFRAGMPKASLALTTNGQKLRPLLSVLKEAGLDDLTVHVDSLKPTRYRDLMGEGDVFDVLDAAIKARSLYKQVKLNMVVQRGKNDDELNDFLSWSEKTQIEVRFIELMNTGSAVEYTRSVFFTGKQMVERIGAGQPVARLERRHASDPAALYRTARGVTFGIIASDTEPFCADCNRLRLTAKGLLRGCLYESGGAPLGPALKAGADDATLASMIRLGQANKRSFHPSTQGVRVPFSMADAGG